MTLSHIATRVRRGIAARLRTAFAPVTFYRGVRIAHRGVLVDQPTFARHLDRVVDELAAGYDRARIESALYDIEVIVFPPPIEEKRIWAGAEWTGGFFDVGLVWIYDMPGWEKMAAKSIRALLVSALDGRGPATPGTWAGDFRADQ